MTSNPTPDPDSTPETARRDRYANALARITVGHSAFIKVDVQAEYKRAEAVMAVADTELAVLGEQLDEAGETIAQQTAALAQADERVEFYEAAHARMRDRLEVTRVRVRRAVAGSELESAVEAALAAAAPSVSAVDQTTRDRIAEAVRRQAETGNVRYEAIADAVLAVLPPTADRAAELVKQIGLRDYWHQEAMSATARIIELETKLRRLADEAQQPAVGARHPKCVLCGHRTCTLGQPCGVIATERGDLPEPCGCTGVGARQPDTETQAVQHAPGKAVLCPDCSAKGRAVCMDAERPRCPHCQMPHDLGPGSSAALACASIRASIADRDASSAVPGRSAATSTNEEQARG